MKTTIEILDDAMAVLAVLIRTHGRHGIAYLPIFERLERERAALVNLDDRLDQAIARRNL